MFLLEHVGRLGPRGILYLKVSCKKKIWIFLFPSIFRYKEKIFSNFFSLTGEGRALDAVTVEVSPAFLHGLQAWPPPPQTANMSIHNKQYEPLQVFFCSKQTEPF